MYRRRILLSRVGRVALRSAVLRGLVVGGLGVGISETAANGDLINVTTNVSGTVSATGQYVSAYGQPPTFTTIPLQTDTLNGVNQSAMAGTTNAGGGVPYANASASDTYALSTNQLSASLTSKTDFSSYGSFNGSSLAVASNATFTINFQVSSAGVYAISDNNGNGGYSGTSSGVNNTLDEAFLVGMIGNTQSLNLQSNGISGSSYPVPGPWAAYINGSYYSNSADYSSTSPYVGYYFATLSPGVEYTLTLVTKAQAGSVNQTPFTLPSSFTSAVTISPVPEPTSGLVLGLSALGVARRRRRAMAT